MIDGFMLGIIAIFTSCLCGFGIILTISRGDAIPFILLGITFVCLLVVIYGGHLDAEQTLQQSLDNDHVREYCRHLGVTDENFVDECRQLTEIIPNGSYRSTWDWINDPKSAESCETIVVKTDNLFEQCITELQSKGIFTSHLDN